MNEAEKLIAKFVETAAQDLASHKAALDRLAENLKAEHATIAELAEIVNRHTEILESLRLAVEAKIGDPAAPGSVH